MVCPVKTEGDILCLFRCLLDLIRPSEGVLLALAFPSVVICLAIPFNLGASACVGEAPRTTQSVGEGSVADEGCIPLIIHVTRVASGKETRVFTHWALVSRGYAATAPGERQAISRAGR